MRVNVSLFLPRPASRRHNMTKCSTANLVERLSSLTVGNATSDIVLPAAGVYSRC